MIVLSLILVIAAAVLLIAGFFQTGLELIYASIAACVLAMIFLGIGVLQRRRARPASQRSGYGPGTGGAAPVRPSGSSRPTSRGEGGSGDVSAVRPSGDSDVVVKKTSAADAPKKTAVKKVASKPAAETAEPAAAAGADEPAETEADAPPPKKVAKKKTAAKKTTKKTTKKATKKKAAKKTKKKAAKKTKKKAAKKKTAKKTTGAEARKQLAGIKGIGPAKQDALLEKFDSIEAMKDASIDELSEVPGIGEATAKTIKSGLK
ncbi:MAG: helix-hairpin-helix domain-containing protein [Nitriliruptorales bacterium]|nr:helix-hairpin-helix domain-containing protein [Nitriliruptorales bacterium]